MAVAAGLVLAATAGAQTSPQSPGSARVASLTGELTVHRGRLPAQLLKLQEAVQPGDELITGPNAEAVIQASDGSTVHVFPDSRVIFSERSADIQEFLHLLLGSIKVHIEKLSGRPNPHRMTTPTAIIAVRGTTFSVFVDETDATLVAVDEGVVAVANARFPADEVLLNRGQRTWVRPGQPPVRAQAFRGRSERADLIPAQSSGSGMSGSAMTGGGMGAAGDSMSGSGSAHSMGGTGGMSGHSGPGH